MGIFGAGKCVYVNTFGRLAVLVLPAGQMLSRNNFFWTHGNCLSGQTFAGTGDSSAERVDEYTFALSRRPRQKTVSWRHENPDPQQYFVPERDSLRAQRNVFPGRHLPRPATYSQIVIA
jgi:hypothetical protein